MNREKIDKVKQIVKQEFENKSGDHDWWHIKRVYNYAIKISNYYPEADLEVIELASLLHDVGDYKLNNKDKPSHKDDITKILKNLDFDQQVIDKVIYIVENMSFSKNIEKKRELPIEGQIVQDADRLEAMGAIGIARCFAYGGKKNRAIYNPEIKPTRMTSKKQYRSNENPSYNHFFEKLLHLIKYINTKEAKQIALQKHRFMVKFVNEFDKEMEGLSE